MKLWKGKKLYSNHLKEGNNLWNVEENGNIIIKQNSETNF
jgi:hypothetical protein